MMCCEESSERNENKRLYLGLAVSVALHLTVIVALIVPKERTPVRVIDLGEIVIHIQKMGGVIRPKEF